jgi:hypothetical protein
MQVYVYEMSDAATCQPLITALVFKAHASRGYKAPHFSAMQMVSNTRLPPVRS